MSRPIADLTDGTVVMRDTATGLDVESVRLVRAEDLDPCGECPKGECDLCEGCRWITTGARTLDVGMGQDQ